ncbi:protein tyrosine kinase domain-containing protein [Hirsutella rhossiliensis]|uniref:EKC/KEOPS complex subunit BUD32 n=1 Tax=Hirsutella rhossiliensis TaxID=111463 RepID=A0A9P8N6L8_9HYPO|nr:protein tyrosine kinase domain-containing protein [Hirsutella rhossiliensis]KAH0965607.1 protein tyrosine kinase domain-containing protein [Hirsutella rhossiliensis]
MPQTSDKVEVPDAILENEVVGYGISSWVLRFDAVAKCYLSTEPHLREREIAVYERLTPPDAEPHDAILPFYGVLDGRSVLLQFARNGSIRQYYAKHNHDTPLHTRLHWAEQITTAIVFLLSKGVLHGDISCNNVFIDEALDAKLGDFAGSSIDGLPFLTVYETSHSLPDNSSVSVKREIFALGSTFYEIMSGHRPFDGMGDCEVESLFRQGRFPDLQQLRALGTVISKCWDGKYSIVEDILQEIKQERGRLSSMASRDKRTRSFSVEGPLMLALFAVLPIALLIRYRK